MGNYIDCQLIVEGPKESIDRFKKLTLEIDPESVTDSYEVCLTELMPGIESVVTRDYFNSLELEEDELTSLLILDEFTNDFDFPFFRSNTFYDWFGNARFTKWSIWVDHNCWSNLYMSETLLSVKFTSLETPPLILIIGGSKLFPDLNFKMSFFDVFDNYETGRIEGANGIFTGVNKEYELIDYQ